MRVRIPIAVTLAAVMAVGSFGITTVSAAPVAPLHVASHSLANDAQLIEVASKKKKRRSNSANNAAAAAAFMGILGGMVALSQQDRYYDRGGYYDRGYGGYGGYNRSYSQNYYGGRNRAYPQRQYRQVNPAPNRYTAPQRNTAPQGGPTIYGGSTVPYGSPDHRGAPQVAPGGGWVPQNAAPDAR